MKKRRDGEESFKVVKTKTTFETADTELINKVREQFPEDQPEPVPEEPIEEQQTTPEEPSDPYKEQGGFLLKITSERSMEYGI